MNQKELNIMTKEIRDMHSILLATLGGEEQHEAWLERWVKTTDFFAYLASGLAGKPINRKRFPKLHAEMIELWGSEENLEKAFQEWKGACAASKA